MASTKKSRSIKSLKKSKDTEPMIHLTTHHTPVVSLEHINQGKFWGWAVFCFVVPFGIVAGILGGVNPPIVQKIDT